MDNLRVVIDAAATLTPVAIMILVIAYVIVQSPLQFELHFRGSLKLKKNGDIGGDDLTPPDSPTAPHTPSDPPMP